MMPRSIRRERKGGSSIENPASRATKSRRNERAPPCFERLVCRRDDAQGDLHGARRPDGTTSRS